MGLSWGTSNGGRVQSGIACAEGERELYDHCRWASSGRHARPPMSFNNNARPPTALDSARVALTSKRAGHAGLITGHAAWARPNTASTGLGSPHELFKWVPRLARGSCDPARVVFGPRPVYRDACLGDPRGVYRSARTWRQRWAARS